MNSILEALAKKLQKDKDQISRLEREMAEINATIRVLEGIQCPACRGRGTIGLIDAAGSVEHETCDKCGGSGIFVGVGD